MLGVKLYTLQVHNTSHSPEDIILNKEVFSHISSGDYIKVVDPENVANPLTLRVNLLQSTGGRVEISLLKSIAEAMNLKSFCRVSVELISVKSALVDFVELSFRRMFLQRGNMWKFKNAMSGKPVHLRQVVQVEGAQAVIEVSLVNVAKLTSTHARNSDAPEKPQHQE